MIGLDQLTYSGNHGFEVLLPGDDLPRMAFGVEKGAAAVLDFVDGLDAERLSDVGIRREDKGAIQAFHWRGVEDDAAAAELAASIAAEASASGLGTHLGRMVLELRPPLDLSKGTAIRALVGITEQLAGGGVLYAGDDRTDIDGFEALSELVASGALSHAARVGIDSPEAPAELAGSADLMLAGPAGFAALLEFLAG